MLLEIRLHELNGDMLLAHDEADALKARSEYNVLFDFASWITQLGQKPQRGGMDIGARNG